MGGSYPPEAPGIRGSCSVQAKIKDKFSRRTSVRAMLCKGVPSLEMRWVVPPRSLTIPALPSKPSSSPFSSSWLSLWSSWSLPSSSSSTIFQSLTTNLRLVVVPLDLNHKDFSTRPKFQAMVKELMYFIYLSTVLGCHLFKSNHLHNLSIFKLPSFLGIEQIQQKPWFPSSCLPSFSYQGTPATMSCCRYLSDFDQFDLQNVIRIAILWRSWWMGCLWGAVGRLVLNHWFVDRFIWGWMGWLIYSITRITMSFKTVGAKHLLLPPRFWDTLGWHARVSHSPWHRCRYRTQNLFGQNLEISLEQETCSPV